MPASRASAATRSKPTMLARLMVALLSDRMQRVAGRHLRRNTRLDSCAACTRTAFPRRRFCCVAQHGHRENSLVWPGSMVPSTAV